MDRYRGSADPGVSFVNKMEHAHHQHVVDLAGLSSRCMRNASLMRKVLMQLSATLSGQIAALRAALDGGDIQGVGAMAHKLKGASATVGAEGVRAEAFALEQASKDGDAEGARLALSHLVTRADEFERSLPSVLASIDAGATSGASGGAGRSGA